MHRNLPGSRSSGTRRIAGSVLGVAMLLGSALAPTAAGAYSFDLPSDISSYSDLAARITYSGNGVNLRSDPSVDGEVLARLPEGTLVQLRVDDVNTVYDEDGDRWWPVRVAGVDGWVIGFYLDGLSGASDSASSENFGATPQFDAGQQAQVATDDGGNLRMRLEPGSGSEEIGKLADGSIVRIVDGPYEDESGNGWYLIDSGAKRAFVIGVFLQGAPAASSAAAFSAGETAAADGALNVRSGPSVEDGVTGRLADGDMVTIVDGPFTDSDGDPWYQVSGAGVDGYAIGLFLKSAQAAKPADTGSEFIYPLARYTFTQAFGCSPYAFEPWDASAGCNFHNGIDLAASAYTPIRAAAGGTVKQAGWCDCGLGYFVEIDHGGGISTFYGHMVEPPPVAAGDSVAQGDVIGSVGSTGLSTGPHVHFMVVVNGVAVDPRQYL